MRRAKMRLVLAIVLLIVAIGGLISTGRNATSHVDMAAQRAVKAAPVAAAPAKPAAPAVVASKAEATKPPPVMIDVDSEAKPPQAPPDPVYTSFTADSTNTAANTPNTPPVAATETAIESDKPAEIPPKPVAAQPVVKSKPVAPAIVENEKIEASANGQYLLQAGVFADMENAKRQLEKLAQHHIDTHVESKVRIGPFANTGEVDSAREMVKGAGIYTPLDEVTTAKGVLLQAGVLTDMESAKQLQTKLSEIGLASRCETRILVGPFDTKAKADAARNKIKALNISVVLL
jgi:cell division protein FtsN